MTRFAGPVGVIPKKGMSLLFKLTAILGFISWTEVIEMSLVQHFTRGCIHGYYKCVFCFVLCFVFEVLGIEAGLAHQTISSALFYFSF